MAPHVLERARQLSCKRTLIDLIQSGRTGTAITSGMTDNGNSDPIATVSSFTFRSDFCVHEWKL